MPLEFQVLIADKQLEKVRGYRYEGQGTEDKNALLWKTTKTEQLKMGKTFSLVFKFEVCN